MKCLMILIRFYILLQFYKFDERNLSFLIVKSGCTCKDLINKHGQGNCQGTPTSSGKHICYVNQPSTCPDAKDSLGSQPGEKFSIQACELNDGKKFQLKI